MGGSSEGLREKKKKKEMGKLLSLRSFRYKHRENAKTGRNTDTAVQVVAAIRGKKETEPRFPEFQTTFHIHYMPNRLNKLCVENKTDPLERASCTLHSRIPTPETPFQLSGKRETWKKKWEGCRHAIAPHPSHGSERRLLAGTLQ
jgi:hypothetical protein